MLDQAQRDAHYWCSACRYSAARPKEEHSNDKNAPIWVLAVDSLARFVATSRTDRLSSRTSEAGRREHGVDAHVLAVGAVHDAARPGAVLCRARALEERVVRAHAVLCDHLHGDA